MSHTTSLCPIVYLNGEYLPWEQAKISVLDRGFLFGDSVYEVIPAYAGRLFHADKHIERLQRSMEKIRLNLNWDTAKWLMTLQKLVELNGGGNLSLYLQVTRGCDLIRYHLFPENMQPTIVAFCTPYQPMSYEELNQGFSAITADDIRWKRCDIKATSLLPNILLRQQAHDAGAVEAILIRDGYAVEASSSNIFIVKEGCLITPPLNNHLLGGTTRDIILELARVNGINYREELISLAELQSADEIWLSGASKLIMPVTQLDGKPVANGQPGLVWQKIFRLFQSYIKRLCSE